MELSMDLVLQSGFTIVASEELPMTGQPCQNVRSRHPLSAEGKRSSWEPFFSSGKALLGSYPNSPAELMRKEVARSKTQSELICEYICLEILLKDRVAEDVAYQHRTFEAFFLIFLYFQWSGSAPEGKVDPPPAASILTRGGLRVQR